MVTYRTTAIGVGPWVDWGNVAYFLKLRDALCCPSLLFGGRNYNICNQMYYFKAKIHQSRFRLGLRWIPAPWEYNGL